jgi:lipopolysaccharide/colanic/teichoic acid biosynthesis glycosyltransferase
MQSEVGRSAHIEEGIIATEKSTFLYCYWSRSIDIFFGICGGFLLLVVLPIVGLLIYLDSPGPIFYSQIRVGYQKRLFRVYKFRSMYPASGRTGHMVWAKAHDARITRFGRFLRASHLDELPQMLNILRGEMSLIGPRPELPTFSNELEEKIPYYNQRFSIKPGLTGWAQVKHHYGDTIEDERIKLQYDLDYIKKRSCAMDISIIVRTVVEVVSGHGR